jgi:putative heme-binding domain-containing protein
MFTAVHRSLVGLVGLKLGLLLGAMLPAADVPGASSAGKAPVPCWIWGADANQRYVLRKEFVAADVTAARLLATCDNRLVLRLNGQEIARSDTWQTPIDRDVHKLLQPGKNVFLAEVANAGGPAGFILSLTLTLPGGQAQHVVSNESWQSATDARAERWQPVRKVGVLGDEPWGNVFAQGTVKGQPPRSKPAAAGPMFRTLPGFQVEHLYSVPREKMGSWVAITFDPKGRLIASDQGNLGLCRITPPPVGSKDPPRVEHLDVKISAAQGLLFAFGSLYVSVNGGPGSGLYRVRDTNGDDHFDEVVKLKALRGGGEHGPHALRLSPDGKSILIVSGNHTDPPEPFQASRIPANWGEDLLLPRQWDANGHARGRLAPGGWIARTDPDGKHWEIVSIGYRNAYDMALNADGELFAYDSDMEWDMGTPWYRPTRVVHATSGSEFGWRSGTGKWPPYYVDSLPPMIDIGPGSPVGVEFGYGARFPARYQKALFICDWTFGTIYAIHLEPDGSTYRAVKEEFLSRTPLPLTDLAVGPDGALYFAIGGRGTQSDLFRVVYVGNEPTAPVEYRDARHADLRALRRQLEAYHAPAAEPARAIAFLWPHLAHPDRFIRYAARVALEHQKPALWQERVLAEKDSQRLITAGVALARQGDKGLQGRLLTALEVLEPARLPEPELLELLRLYQLVFIRMGEPDKETAARLAARLDSLYPAASDPVNRELCILLVYLKSPSVVAKTTALLQQPFKPLPPDVLAELLERNRGYGEPIARMLANLPDLQKFHYAFQLRNLRDGWTLEQRKVFYQWVNQAKQRSGGNSYLGFINNLEKDAWENTSDVERLAIEAAGLRKPFQVKALPAPIGPGRDWKLADLLALESRLKGRDFKNGQRAYAASRCIVCHRFNGEGGATGPDLTQLAGRFNLKELCESLVEPSKVISDQYRASVVTTRSGKVYTGKIVSETRDVFTLVIDPEDSTKVVDLKKAEVEEVLPSKVSLMPEDLLKPLNENEVLDLLAYLLSRGDPKHAMFRK